MSVKVPASCSSSSRGETADSLLVILFRTEEVLRPRAIALLDEETDIAAHAEEPAPAFLLLDEGVGSEDEPGRESMRFFFPYSSADRIVSWAVCRLNTNQLELSSS